MIEIELQGNILKEYYVYRVQYNFNPHLSSWLSFKDVAATSVEKAIELIHKDEGDQIEIVMIRKKRSTIWIMPQ